MSRRADMTANDVAMRARHARAFLDSARTVDLLADEDADPAVANVVTSLAVLAGIAASDAICGRALRQRASGEAHTEAVELLARATTRGAALSTTLRRLLAVKTRSQYSPALITPPTAADAVRWAATLVDGMDEILREP